MGADVVGSLGQRVTPRQRPPALVPHAEHAKVLDVRLVGEVWQCRRLVGQDVEGLQVAGAAEGAPEAVVVAAEAAYILCESPVIPSGSVRPAAPVLTPKAHFFTFWKDFPTGHLVRITL